MKYAKRKQHKATERLEIKLTAEQKAKLKYVSVKKQVTQASLLRDSIDNLKL